MRSGRVKAWALSSRAWSPLSTVPWRLTPSSLEPVKALVLLTSDSRGSARSAAACAMNRVHA